MDIVLEVNQGKKSEALISVGELNSAFLEINRSSNMSPRSHIISLAVWTVDPSCYHQAPVCLEQLDR